MGYQLKDGVLKLAGTINLLKWDLKSFKSLGKICAVHHKGKDGKIKTWSDVLIEISAKVQN